MIVNHKFIYENNEPTLIIFLDGNKEEFSREFTENREEN